MARLFDDAQSQYLEIDQIAVGSVPISIACWCYPDAVSRFAGLVVLADKDVANMQQILRIDNNDKINATSWDASGAQSAVTSTTVSVNTWHHAAAVFAANNDRRAYLDGGGKGTSATSRTPVGLDRMSIGRAGDSTPGIYMSGRIAEVGIWNAALSDDEIASLAKGASPLLVKPANLVAYWNLFGRSCPEPDIVGGFDMTLC